MARYVAAASRVLGPQASMVVPSSSAAGPPTALSTGAAANSAAPTTAVPVVQLFQGWQQSFLSAPLFWLGGLVLFLIAWKLIEEHRGGQEAFAKIRVDGTNLIKVTAMTMLGFIIAKYFARAYNVPGISAAVLSA